MSFFNNSVPFRSSWWADSIQEANFDFWPFAHFDAFALFGLPRSVRRDQRSLQHSGQKELSHEVLSDKYKFQVTLNIPHFKANEISVKVVDKYLDVKAEHEEKQDEHGHVYRHFHRRYILPNNADLDQFSSTHSDSGTLVVCAPKKHCEAKTERTIELIEVKQIISVQDQPKTIDGNHKKGSVKNKKKKMSDIQIPVSHAATTGKKK